MGSQVMAVEYAVSLIVSSLVCVLLLVLEPLFETVFLERNDAGAIQASHDIDRLRFGGIGVLLGLLAGVLFLQDKTAGSVVVAVFLCSLPVVASGILEDIGHRVMPWVRFLMALMSAGLCVVTFNTWVTRIDWAPLDALLGIPALGIILTVLSVAVFSHSVNLIDGMNGLCSSAVICMLVGFSYVGYKADVPSISVVSLLLATAVLGFLILNWPVGFIFLGDAGAYALGHFTIWIGILLLNFAPQTAAPAILLILFYPLADTVHTILRRVVKKHSMLKPDRMHLHHKVRRGLEVLWLGSSRKNISNPLTTVCLFPFLASPAVVGAIFWNNPMISWLALGLFSVLFAAAHGAAITAARRLRKRKPVASRIKRFAQ